MRTDFVDFQEQAIADYDAAFDWYLARSQDGPLKFDAEVDRALAETSSCSPSLGSRLVLYSQVLAETISFHSNLPRTAFCGHSDRSGCPHCPKARLLEEA